MSQVVSESFYTSAAETLLKLGFDHWVAIVLMVIDHDGEITDARHIILSGWCWLTEAPVS